MMYRTYFTAEEPFLIEGLYRLDWYSSLCSVERGYRVAASRSGVLWRATVDKDGHYVFAVAL